MNPKFARLAALGAVGVSFGVLAVYALIAFGSRPGTLSGVDRTHAMVTWISVAVPAAAVIAAHLAYVKILLDHARGKPSY